MVRIDAVQLTEVRLSDDATRLHLTMIDQAGDKALLSMPASCLNKVLTSLPGHLDPGPVHKLDSWSMGLADDRQDLLLTLRTPEGLAISFTLKHWQVDGMATLAAHSRPRPIPAGTVH